MRLALIFAILLSITAPAFAQVMNAPAVPVVSGSAVGTFVVKASGGAVYSIYATNQTATAGYLLVFDSATVPADGAVTPIVCVTLPASGTSSVSYIPSPPALFSRGITAAASSASSCFTKTTGVITAFFSAIIQ